MQVLIFEDNLIWSGRFTHSLKGLGHDPVVASAVPETTEAKVAIVNLGSTTLCPSEIVPLLREKGIYVIGHAGHKEKELHALGAEIGCDRLATNSEITFKIETLISTAFSK
ncbi:MAG: hypothetical protein KF784_15295 [Fimbriimonadaceae bacterium]|nr:hypothetical protein [Fimbriimonadaceae bacterium]